MVQTYCNCFPSKNLSNIVVLSINHMHQNYLKKTVLNRHPIHVNTSYIWSPGWVLFVAVNEHPGELEFVSV